MKQDLVKDWMATDVISVEPETTLHDAHKLMKKHSLRRLPVLKNGKLAGIVTLSDVLEAEPSDATTLSVYELNYLLAKLTVNKIMTKAPITVQTDAPLGQVAEIMLEKKIGGLPVVDNTGNLVGIITESDIFRRVVKGWSDE